MRYRIASAPPFPLPQRIDLWSGADGDVPAPASRFAGQEGDGGPGAPDAPVPGRLPRPGGAPLGVLADLLIRAAGVAGIGVSIVLFVWLYRTLHAAPSVAPALADYLVAGIGFLAGSAGAGALALGRHVNDHIVLAERWRRRM